MQLYSLSKRKVHLQIIFYSRQSNLKFNLDADLKHVTKLLYVNRIESK